MSLVLEEERKNYGKLIEQSKEWFAERVKLHNLEILKETFETYVNADYKTLRINNGKGMIANVAIGTLKKQNDISAYFLNRNYATGAGTGDEINTIEVEYSGGRDKLEQHFNDGERITPRLLDQSFVLRLGAPNYNEKSYVLKGNDETLNLIIEEMQKLHSYRSFKRQSYENVAEDFTSFNEE